MFFTRLFKTHFLIVTEQQFLDLDIEIKPHHYCKDDKHWEELKEVVCCGKDVPCSYWEVKELYGGRGLEFVRLGTCLKCGRNDFTMRIRDGYFMSKDDKGNYLLTILQDPLVKQWWIELKNFLTPA